MKLCRFNDDRLGLVDGDEVLDVSAALEILPQQRWPLPAHDLLIASLSEVCERVQTIAAAARVLSLQQVKLHAPVANPGKIIGAPINYRDHLEESKQDQGIAHGREIKTIGDWGLFLKANSALVGPADGIELRFPERRNDHEVELAVVIGRRGSDLTYHDALDYVAGYCIGLDMTARGPEVPSFRKSIDSYAVLGPWLVTQDDIADPDELDLSLRVNGELRQQSNTRFLDYDVRRLIEYASSFYTLYPGDVIMTGTPAGVGPVHPGDLLVAEIAGIGAMQVSIR